MPFKTIEWKNGKAVMLDQRKLPGKKTYLKCSTHKEVAEAICSMAIRGAPAIGIAAAMGFALGAAENKKALTKRAFLKKMSKVHKTLGQTRPTAVNLFWALERMEKLLFANSEMPPEDIAEILKAEAMAICEEDLDLCKKIGKAGEPLIKDGATIMTHCNAGGLATAGYGTALGVLRAARDAGKKINVISSETRPLLQGSRLTAWELTDEKIPVTVITDTAAGFVMKNRGVDAVIVGADRIAANCDVANKIGTYQLSVLAKHHGVAFYVAAPWSTVDMNCASGKDIPIEERSGREVSHIGKTKTAAGGAKIINPAFDITPAENIDCIITDRGLVKPPCGKELKKLSRPSPSLPGPQY